MAKEKKPVVKSDPDFRTIGVVDNPKSLRSVNIWLIQDGVTPGEGWIWRTVVSKTDANNDKDAMKIAEDRCRSGQESEPFKKVEAA